jgi:hypothetical protein
VAVDEFLPAFDVNEVHSTHVRASPERAMHAVRSLTAGEVPLLVTLMTLRGLPELIRGRVRLSLRGRIVDQILSAGFVVLAERPGELVVGGVGRFWLPGGGIRPLSPEEFHSFAEPGYARAAMEFRALVQADGQTLLTTETRVDTTDDSARRSFRRYWRLVHPRSAAIRRAWLRAARRRAERG